MARKMSRYSSDRRLNVGRLDYQQRLPTSSLPSLIILTKTSARENHKTVQSLGQVSVLQHTAEEFA